MTRKYLSQIKKIFWEEKIQELKFLQGLKCYDITDQLSEDKVYKKRPYVLYKGKKNGKKIIIKILIRENYLKFYQRELFVYKYLSKIIPQTEKFVPKLVGERKKPPTMFIKFFEGYTPLGKSNLLLEKLKKEQLVKIIEVIDSFHILKEEMERKIKEKGLVSPFVVGESFSFYYRRYLRETKRTLKEIFGKREVEKLENLFLKTQKIFNKEKKYFSWGDANFSNILIKKEARNFQFKFLDFEKVDYAPLFRDYTTLFYSVLLADQILASFFKKLLEKKYPEKNFWLLFYFKLLIYSLPRQWTIFFEEKRFNLQEKIYQLGKMFLLDFYSFF